MSNPTREALAAAMAKKADEEMMALAKTADTSSVCEAIAGLQVFTVADAANIVRALMFRAANLPIMAPKRQAVINTLQANHELLIDLWGKV